MSNTTDEAREAVHKAIDHYRASLFSSATGAFFDAEARLTRALDAFRDVVAARAREEGAREVREGFRGAWRSVQNALEEADREYERLLGDGTFDAERAEGYRDGLRRAQSSFAALIEAAP